jgi:outer membrane receptor protein involved in Fe transport
VSKHLVWLASAAAIAPAAAYAQAPAKPPPAKPAAPAKPAPKEVEGVTVTGQTQAAPLTTSIDRRTYDVGKDLQATTGSIADALRNIPSVQVDVQGNLSLRGDTNVTIMIDGKPSGIFRGDGRGAALQSLPADRIERVEVITNPSAEFRADGTAGIINLITKKAQGAGRTGSVRVNLGTRQRSNAGASIGYNSKQTTVTGDVAYRHDTQGQTTLDERLRPDTVNRGTSVYRDTGRVRAHLNQVNGRLALDYDLDKADRLSAEARGNYGWFRVGSLDHLDFANGAGVPLQSYDRFSDNHQHRGNGELTAGWRRKFDGDGHDLNVRLSYETTDDIRHRLATQVNLVPATGLAYEQLRVGNLLDQTELKADYTRPMAGGAKLKLGYDLEFTGNDIDYRVSAGSSPTGLVVDPNQTNLFKYEQTLNQAYVTYERPIGDVTVLAGLRAEDEKLDLNQVTQAVTGGSDRFRLYPSLHLAWKVTDEQQLTASYSHRVTRPNANQLNPFRFRADPLSFVAGNPDLRPQETHSYELGWQYRKAPAFLLATLYYRETYRAFTPVVRDLPGGAFLQTTENLSKFRNGGLELVAAGRLVKNVTYNVSANAFWQQLYADPLGFTDRRSGVSFSGRGNLNWQVTANDFFQANAFVNGKTLFPQGYVKPTGMLNLGYRHKLNDKLSFVATAQDVLNTFENKQVLNSPTLKGRLNREIDTTAVFLGFTWTFGGGRAPQGFDFGGGGPPAN